MNLRHAGTRLILAVVVLTAVLGLPATAFADTNVTGTVSADATWVLAGSGYDLLSSAATYDPGTGAAFKPAVAYTVGSYFYPLGIAVGDVTGDGKLDLVTANAYNNSVSVLAGTGVGTFGPVVSHLTGSGIYPQAIAVGDVNGDGRRDLVTANGYGTVSVLVANGGGTFKPAVNYPVVANPKAVAVSDLNRDGTSDLVTANGWGTASVFMGSGDGTFAPKTDYQVGQYACAVAIADVDSDGSLDVVACNRDSSTVSVLLGNGDGTFAVKADYATGSGPRSVAVGDLNGDLKLDLATANAYVNTVSVLLGRGDGSFDAKTDFSTGLSPEAIAISDFNGDGNMDFVTANVDNTISELFGKGDGSFAAPTNYGIGAGEHSVAVADFDGDGLQDVATANGNAGVSTVSVLLGNADAAISGPSHVMVGQEAVFDASGSAVPGRPIIDFSWDFDGSGSFNADTGTTPVVGHVFTASGTYQVAVRVIREGGRVDEASTQVEVVPLPPTITGLVPALGPVGATVTLTGTNLTGATAVKFNGTSASFTVTSSTQIAATVPVGATSGRIAVTTPGGSAISAASFTVMPKSRITSLSPLSGRRGVIVTITGTGFRSSRGTAYVRLGTMKCGTYVSWSNTRIRCKVPARAALGRLYVRVTTAGGTSNAKTFTVKR